MNVGKDPFPGDEVTGLAAFDHIQPVGSLNVVPEESVETPVLTEESEEPEAGLQPPAEAENANARKRVDATLPLNLSAMPHWQDVQAAANGGEEAPAEERTEPAEAPAQTKPSTLDAMFSGAAGAGWDDEDETTRVHSHPAGRAPSGAELDMEWDEEEPATEMKPFAMFDAPPVAARHDWPDWNTGEDATSTYLPRGTSSIRSATPTIRIATPPLQTTLPPVQPRANALSGGRPSPFPSAQPALDPVETADEPDEARASAFDGLLPIPAPPLPAAGASPRKPDSESLQVPARFLEALKAGHRPSIIIAAGGAVGLLALVLIVRAIAADSVGTAVLEVSPADAQVQVDGKSVSGSGSPYTVSELAPGDHEVVAKKAGYNDYRGRFVVNAGANTKLPVIELAPNLRDVGFSVRSVPVGAEVWVDGEKTEQVTPAKLTGIKPGIHRLALKHEGFSDYELQMFVPEATVLQLPAAELVALPAAPAEPTRPARRSRRGATDDSESYGTRRSRRVSASDAADSERSSRSYTSSAGASYSSRTRSRSADDADELAAPAADGGKMGTLRLNSRPWAQVSVDGRPVGNTPQPNLQLSAGKHKIQLSNPQLGLHKSVTVTIKPGEIATQVVNLAE